MEQVVSNDASTARQRIKLKLERDLANVKSLATPCCIYKVPQILRDANKEDYTPKVISIGPYHCRRKNLYAMQSMKIRYLQSFLERTGLELLNSYIERAQGWEEKVRGNYDEECDLDSDEFVQMILMDGIFIVEFTWQWYIESNQGSEGPSSLRYDIIRDLLLLENQLPFFVLTGLANRSFPDPDNSREWIVNLTKLFIDHFDLMPTSDSTNWSHLILEYEIATYKVLHLVGFIHEIICEPIFSTSVRELKLELSGSATQLQEAGVKLGCATDLISEAGVKLGCATDLNLEAGVKFGCPTDLIFTDIDFKKESGLLQIPRLVVNRNTESLFRNIIAYEHCHHKVNKFRSYVILMDCLINTSQDVQLLVHSKIIRNSLGENEDVCTLFNNLYKMPMMDSSEFCFADLCQSLNEYSRNPWRKWKARWFKWKLIFKRDYISSPWSIVSVIAAFILLSLTAIQTLCSIKGVKW